jgi:hypothetical protein
MRWRLALTYLPASRVKGASDAVLETAELAQVLAKYFRHTWVRQAFEIALSAVPLPITLIVVVDPQCIITIKGNDKAL